MTFAQQTTTICAADGSTRDLAPGEQLPPGAQVIRVRVPRMMTDAAGAPVSVADHEARDQARQDAWLDMKNDIGSAWKGLTKAPTTDSTQQQSASRATDKELADQAYETHKRDLATAWQGNSR